MGKKISQMTSLAYGSALGTDQLEVARSSSSSSFRFTLTALYNWILALFYVDTTAFTATMVCGTSGTITVNNSASKCYYTKVGKVVHYSLYITVTSVSSPLGSLRIAGLPIANIAGVSGTSSRLFISGTNAYIGSALGFSDGSQSLYIRRDAGTGADPADDMAAAIKANTEIYVSFTMPAAA